MPMGALVAIFFKGIEVRWVQEEFKHGVIAFGGGALLSAISLVLVPQGMDRLDSVVATILFILGALSFMCIDIYLDRKKTAMSQLVAMLSDFIPESLALGAAFSAGDRGAYLLAGLIGLQNFPEGFNSYCELNSSSSKKSFKIIGIFFLMALLGPISVYIGFTWLSVYPAIISGVMLFAAGGILYSVFQDIAPQVKLENHWSPPLGAIAGFALGMLGAMIID